MEKKTGIYQWLRYLIVEKEKIGQFKTAQCYENCLRSFSSFYGKKDPKLSELTSLTMMNYQRFLLEKNVRLNTISFYMRILRAAYYKALKSELVVDRNLFSDVYTGVAKTEKRAVNVDIIQLMKKLELTDKWGLAFSRDLFLLSFYFRGMAFVDMARLKKTDVSAGIIRYTRSKTKQDLRIKIEPCALEILNRYPSDGSEFLLPILSPLEHSQHAYDSALRLHNKRLSTLSKMLNLPQTLSSYVARHSWATLAKRSGVDLTIISESLGHNSVATTQIYLDSLDHDRIDDANSLVISMVG